MPSNIDRISAGLNIVPTKPLKSLSSDENIDEGLNDFDFNIDISDIDAIRIAILIVQIAIEVYIKNHNSAAGVLGDSDNKDNLSITINKNPLEGKNDKKRIFMCKNDLYNHINSLDLGEYLGIYDNMVCCILPEHEDNRPSAHIYKNENGMPFYKCFGCGKARSIIGITEHLAGCKRHEAIEFLKNVYDLELQESEWTKTHKELMIECANYLNSDEFKLEFPELNKAIRTRKHHIQMLLVHFSEMINEDMMFGNKPIFFGSYPQLMEVCNMKNCTQLAQSLSLFALLNLIEKLPESKIPKKELPYFTENTYL